MAPPRCLPPRRSSQGPGDARGCRWQTQRPRGSARPHRAPREHPTAILGAWPKLRRWHQAPACPRPPSCPCPSPPGTHSFSRARSPKKEPFCSTVILLLLRSLWGREHREGVRAGAVIWSVIGAVCAECPWVGGKKGPMARWWWLRDRFVGPAGDTTASWEHRAMVCVTVAPSWRSPGLCWLLPLRSHHLPSPVRTNVGVMPPKPALRICRGPLGAPPALPRELSELIEVLGWRWAPPTPLPHASLPASPTARTGERQREERRRWGGRPGHGVRGRGAGKRAH